MARLIVSLEAQQDVRSIVAYLRRNAGMPVADKYAVAFDEAADLLSDFPGIGTLSPELGPIARRYVISPYVLIYDFDSSSDTATVLRIVHGRRNITVDLIRRR
jgi:plasmid stabilization system protein ParE